MSNLGVDHWKTITRSYQLHYTRYLIVLEGYSDTKWISNI